MILVAIALPASLDFAKAAEIDWLSGVADSDEIVVNRGVLVEAANFGNRNTSSPTINTVLFQAVDFTSSGTLSNLSGLTYNTGESGKYQGKGFQQFSIREKSRKRSTGKWVAERWGEVFLGCFLGGAPT